MNIINTINRKLYGENVDAIPTAIMALLFGLLVSLLCTISDYSRYPRIIYAYFTLNNIETIRNYIKAFK